MSGIYIISDFLNGITACGIQTTEASSSVSSVLLVCGVIALALVSIFCTGGAGDREEVPAETMQKLREHFDSWLRERGIALNEETERNLLADYAARGLIWLYPAADIKPVIAEWMKSLLQLFFLQEDGASAESKFMYSQQTLGPDCTEIRGEQCGPVLFTADNGVSETAFRALVRETEEEFFLPEEVWRKLDDFFKSCAVWSPDIGNHEIRCAERMSSVMLALGATQEETINRILNGIFVPCLYHTGSYVDPQELEKFISLVR